jgi:hypothetical protein
MSVLEEKVKSLVEVMKAFDAVNMKMMTIFIW